MANETLRFTLTVKDQLSPALDETRRKVDEVAKSTDAAAKASDSRRFGFKKIASDGSLVARAMQSGSKAAQMLSSAGGRVQQAFSRASQHVKDFAGSGNSVLHRFAGVGASAFDRVAGAAGGLASKTRGAVSRIGDALSRGASAGRSFAGRAREWMGSFYQAHKTGIDRAASALSGFASKARGIAGRVGNAFKSIGTAAVVAAGTIATAGLTVALTKGWARLQNIEQAKASLEGLGHSAKSIESLMESANASVKGTAFGLDEAAGVAASFAAAGVESGDTMTRALTLVGDAATIGKSTMTEMGAIFGKVAAKGKLDGEVMQQLMERQIGILPALAEHYGVSREEASKMVSQGKVDFEAFSEVMEKTLGGAALKSGETVTGAWKNTQAALGRIGETMLKPFHSAAPKLLMAITGLLDKINDALKPVMERVGEAMGPVLNNVADMLTGLAEGGMSGLLDVVKELAPGLGGVVGALAAVAGGAGKNIPMIGKFLGALNPVVGAILGVVAASPELRNALFDAFVTIGGEVMGVVSELAPHLGGLADMIGGVLTEAVGIVVPVITELAQVLGPVLGQTLKVVLPLAGVLAGVAVSLLQALLPAVGKIFEAIMPLVSAFGDLVVALTPILGLIAPLVGLLAKLLIPVIELLANVIVAAVQVIVPILTWMVNAVTWLINGMVDVVRGAAEWFQNDAGPMFSSVWDGIVVAATWAWHNVLKPIWDGMRIAFLVVATAIGITWEFVLKPIFKAVAEVALWLWNTALAPVFGWIGRKWSDTLAGMKVIWETVLRPALAQVAAHAQNLWATYLSPVFARIRAGWQVVGQWFRNVVDSWIRPAWNGVKTVVNVVWSGISVVFAHMKNAVALVAQSFRNAKDSIAAQWGRLKDITARPVRFIVDTVYTGGIRKVWNGIADAVKMKDLKLPAVSFKFADGGVMPGYTPGRDVHHFTSPTGGSLHLSGGEAIMRPEWTRAVGGPAAVAQMNRDARRGRIDHQADGTAFARGGVYMPGVNAFADSGVWRGLWAIVKQAIPGAIKTSAYRGGSVTASGNRSYHARGMAVDLAGPMGKIFNFLRSNYANSREIIYSPGGGRQIKNGRNYYYTGAVRRMHFNHVHWANTKVPAGAPDYDPGEAGGDSMLTKLFELGPLKNLKKKFDQLPAAGNWSRMLAGGGKALIDKLVDKAKPLQWGEDLIEGAKDAAGRGIAWGLGQSWAVKKGLGPREIAAMNYIVSKESGWNPKAQNPRSTASGLPQFINDTSREYLGGAPAKKYPAMTQLDGMHRYVKNRYGGWLGAMSFWKRNRWYKDGGVVGQFDNGGPWPDGMIGVNRSGDTEMVLTAEQSDVLTAGMRAMAAAAAPASSGRTLTIEHVEVNINGPVYGVDDLDEYLRDAVEQIIEDAAREWEERQ